MGWRVLKYIWGGDMGQVEFKNGSKFKVNSYVSYKDIFVGGKNIGCTVFGDFIVLKNRELYTLLPFARKPLFYLQLGVV
jgi:hypothetical protein